MIGQSKLKNMWQAWQKFWFDPVDLLNIAVFRIILCGTLAAQDFGRQWDVGLFFTDQGILPKALSLKVLPESYRPFAILSFWSDTWVFAVHALLVFALLCVCLGVGGRLMGLLAAFLHLAFLHRNYGIAFGADQIGGIFLLYLALTKCQSRLSILRLCKPPSGSSAKSLSSGLLTPMFYRMVQIQLCVIYAYSGMEKLKGQTWWDGTALWSVLANPQMVVINLSWLRHLPFVIVILSFSTILFEIYFPVLVWVRSQRSRMLTMGVMFHSGIGLVMALWSFSLVMISPYVLFLEPGVLEMQLRKFLRK